MKWFPFSAVAALVITGVPSIGQGVSRSKEARYPVPPAFRAACKASLAAFLDDPALAPYIKESIDPGMEAAAWPVRYTRPGYWYVPGGLVDPKRNDPTRPDNLLATYDQHAQTAQITSFMDLEHDSRGDLSPDRNLLLPVAQARQIAEDFLRRHFAPYRAGVFVFDDTTPHGDGFTQSFNFFPRFSERTITGAGAASVAVDRRNGHVVMYIGQSLPISGPVTARITREQALAIARRYPLLQPPDEAGREEWRARLALRSDGIGGRNLHWIVVAQTIVNRETRFKHYNSIVYIDALTGEVVEVPMPLSGLPGPKKMPPAAPPPVLIDSVELKPALGTILSGGRLFVPLGTAQLLQWRVERKSSPRRATLVRGERRVEVVAPPARKGAPAPGVLFRKGEIFIPLRWLATLSGASLAWDGRKRQAQVGASPIRPGSALLGSLPQ